MRAEKVIATFFIGLILIGSANAAAIPIFKAETNGFSFDTGVMHGRIQANKKTFGVVPVRESSGHQVVARSMGWLAVYRVFSDGQRYGDGGWDWPGQTRLQKDGSLLVRCPAETNRPFTFEGVYRWHDPLILDFEISVTPAKRLKNFEVFVANYFSPDFTNAAVVARPARRGEINWLRAERAKGDWQMFPRDAKVVPLIQDGRWQLEPHPVAWTIQPEFALPVAIRRAPVKGWTVAIMGDPRECFAIAMPYEDEGHYSVYFSTFGRDLPARKTAKARFRLQWLNQVDALEIEKAWARFKTRR